MYKELVLDANVRRLENFVASESHLACLPARYYKLVCFLLVSFFLVSVVSRVFFGVIVE